MSRISISALSGVMAVLLCSGSCLAASDQQPPTSSRNLAEETRLPGAAEKRASDTDHAKKVVIAVESEIYHDGLVSLNDVEVRMGREGVIVLTGRVPSLIAKERATHIAESVKGVINVRNDIVVAPRVEMDADDLESTIIQALVTNPATEAFQIQVEAEPDGNVMLTGEVDSWAERELAGRVAKGVKGVTELRNDIDIDYQALRADGELQVEIERLLRWDAYVDEANVDVSVEEGVVKLSGSVPSAAEKRRAIAMAWTAGAKAVESERLEVSPSGSQARASNAQASQRMAAQRMRPKARIQQFAAAQPQSARAKVATQPEGATQTKKMSEEMSDGMPDAEIAQAVRTFVDMDPLIKADEIEVTVERGVVTLRGKVDTLKEQRAMIAHASMVTGVRDVRDRLRVSRGEESPEDDEIARQIVAGLAANPITEAYDLVVGVEDGIVSLTGSVDSFFERGTADDVAASVLGVREVNNNLEVTQAAEGLSYDPYVDAWSIYEYDWYTPPPITSWKPDAIIAEEIEQELGWSPFVDADEITVSVDKGVATLTGSVDSLAERQAATENAFEGGAAGVVNQLAVSG